MLHGFYAADPDITGNPALGIAANSSIFETRRTQHIAACGGSVPGFASVYVDASQDFALWPAGIDYLARSWSLSSAAAMIPVMAVPLCRNADAGNPQPAYMAIAAGAYDTVFASLVRSWVNYGFRSIYVRLGYDGNAGSQPWDVGADPGQADLWIAAFQRIAGIMRGVSGIAVSIVWSLALTGPRPLSLERIYPGDAYVDAVGLSLSSEIAPSDLYSWSRDDGSADASLALWALDPVNRAHYWNWPSGVQATPTGQPGDGSAGLGALLAFAHAHVKPVAIGAAGVGNRSDPGNAALPFLGYWDDPAFPVNLATMLQADGVQPTLYIIALDLPGANGDWTFSNPAYTGPLTKPLAAAAWAALFADFTDSGASIFVRWTAPAPPVTSYLVQYRFTGTTPWITFAAAVPTTSVTITGLATNTAYDIAISATNDFGTGPQYILTNIVQPAIVAPAAGAIVITGFAPS